MIPCFVMAGLDPAIQGSVWHRAGDEMDGRVRHGHDG
jgi:hypothetical protein